MTATTNCSNALPPDMKLSPLQLLHSQFLGISIVARKVNLDTLMAGSDMYPAISGEQVESRIELGLPDEGEANQFVVKVSVHTVKELPDNFPYQFAMQIEGIFRIDHDGDPEERKRLVVINGGSMLTGIVREQLLALTLRHKNGPLLLPSFDLRGLSPASKPGTSKSVGTSATKDSAKIRKRVTSRKKSLDKEA
ncbi:MAG TPA: hypothetical protein PLN31_17290 [Azoarcus taiwanensis]|nr:hypothetical protein [Azoarcus taiwanensis]